MADQFVIAVADTTVFHNGSPVSIVSGQIWQADNPVVKARPGLFTDDFLASGFVRVETSPVLREAPVEQATAAPGEKRATKRTAKK